jgi:hypothetical protein
MRRLIIFAILFSILISCKKDVITPPQLIDPGEQPDTLNLKDYNKDITIANWNIEWFGDGSMFKGNLNDQESNAGKILTYLNADLYGLCEIVDTARLGRMVRNSLGDEFRYIVSIYPSFSNAQKLAFVYNRNIFRNVKTRPFMGLSAAAYNYFAQRFPYLLTADVVVNGSRNTISFFLIHAKANADPDSYNRRLNGAIELKDSLDLYYGGKNFMILGDFNDHLNGSILSGKDSPYISFINDANYDAVTLPLNTTGYQSTISYTNSVIDQQIISKNMTGWYIGGTAQIRTDVTNVVPDYHTRNTSDHYPVSSMYRVVK